MGVVKVKVSKMRTGWQQKKPTNNDQRLLDDDET